MKLRPEVVRFLEAQARLTLAQERLGDAGLEVDNASRAFRRSFGALTRAEQTMVNDACSALVAQDRPHEATREAVG